MNLLVFGATGGTGRACIEQALARGWRVTAFLRDPAKLQLEHPNLSLAVGDVLRASTIEHAYESSPFDACVCSLGVFHSRPSTELSDGTRNVIEALEARGPRRIVLISTLGTAESRAHGNLFVKFFTRIVLRHVLADKLRQEALLRNGTLDYTILRPPQLVDEAIGQHPVCWWGSDLPRDMQPLWKIARADVAAFARDAIERNCFVREAIQLSWRRGP